MAETEQYGQPSRAEEILDKLLQTAEFQDKELIDIAISTKQMGETLIDMKVGGDVDTKQAAIQQGVENELSRLSQHNTEKTSDEMIEAKKKGGLATEDSQEEHSGYLADLKTKAHHNLVETVKGWRNNANAWLENKASFSNFQGALKTDFNLFTGKLQLLTQLPGVTTLLSGIKMILATALLWIAKGVPFLGKIVKVIAKLFGKGEWAEKMGLGEKKKRIKDPGEWKPGQSDAGGAKYRKWKADSELYKAQKESDGIIRKSMDGLKKGTTNLTKKTGRGLNKLGTKIGDGFGKLSKGAGKLSKKLKGKLLGKDGLWEKTKSGFGNMGRKVKGMFSKDSKLMKTMNTMGTKLKSGMGFIKKGFGKLGGMLKTVGRAAYAAIAAVVSAMWTALVAVGSAIVAALGTISAPVWLIIAAVILIGVGLYIFWEDLKRGWAKMKEDFKRGIKKLKALGPKIKNWFTDTGEDIAYNIKWLIARIKDGVLNMANWIIDKVNYVLPKRWEIEKFDVSNVKDLEAKRSEQLKDRTERDAELDNAVAAAKKSEDDVKLAETTVATTQNTPPVINNVNNTSQNRSHFTGQPLPRDSFMRAQNEVR
jgi:hypothetical protein